MDSTSCRIKFGIQDEGIMEAYDQEVINFSYCESLM